MNSIYSKIPSVSFLLEKLKFQLNKIDAKYLKEFYDFGVVGFSSVYRTVRAARFLVERADILQNFGEDNEC